MACKCAYAKSFFSRGDKGYYCRNKKRLENRSSNLCCGTYLYSTGHASPDISMDYGEMDSCSYRKTELTAEEKAEFCAEDEKEKKMLNRIEKSLDNLTREDMIRLKYSDY
jgi:hypothetical protein